MSCGGCGRKTAAAVGYTKAADGRYIQDDAMTAAAMCLVCPRAGVVSCLVDGRPMEAHVKALDCPLGTHPSGGRVRWLGVKWYGVPLPLRKSLERMGYVTNGKLLPGCGCIARIKDVWEWASLVLRSTKDHLWHKIQPSTR